MKEVIASPEKIIQSIADEYEAMDGDRPQIYHAVIKHSTNLYDLSPPVVVPTELRSVPEVLAVFTAIGNMVDGLLAVSEGWTYPPEVQQMMYSMTDDEVLKWREEHGRAEGYPGAVEIAWISLVLKNGEIYQGMKYRDQELQVVTNKTPGIELGGELIDQLKACLGVV